MRGLQRLASGFFMAGVILMGIVTLVAGDKVALASPVQILCPCDDNGSGNANCDSGCRNGPFPCGVGCAGKVGTACVVGNCNCNCTPLGGGKCGCR
jgi:hypothetical protein